MENIEKNLDELLRLILAEGAYIQFDGTAYRRILSELNLNDNDLLEYCEMLAKDEYIILNKTINNNQDPIVGSAKLKLNGIYFIRQGGYVGKMEYKNLERIRVLTLENQQMNLQNTQTVIQKGMFWVTVVLAVGTLAQLTWQIWKDTHFFCFGH